MKTYLPGTGAEGMHENPKRDSKKTPSKNPHEKV
jgi:hypothetical protein